MCSDMGLFEDNEEKIVTVESGGAAILDLPKIESHPPPSMLWFSDQDVRSLPYDRKYAYTPTQLIILSADKADEKAYR